MRLIDADALLENIHKKRNPQEGADSTNQRHRYMQFLGDCEVIRNAPTVDAVPVVRCKDCKYRNEYGYCTMYLAFHHLTGDMDFCSDAERKEE